ncbi:DUF5681 domain-containing protein [Sphingobium sp. AN641]|uniref:DUF5681 domain-containing protein n=1 Tax=Sphingobium sp. AN641 TaxID=3133443 RepID=UPI0030C14C36
MRDNDDDEVGYKKPPKASRFQKGKSGNPRGRPKKRASVDVSHDGSIHALLKNEFKRLVVVTENGQPEQITLKQALARAMAHGAVKNSRIERKQAFDLLSDMDQAEQAQRTDDFKFWRGHKKDQLAIIEQARREGREPEKMRPHPDDIQVDWGKGCIYLLGPLTDEDEVLFDLRALTRECCYIASEWNTRWPGLEIVFQDKRACPWGVLGELVNRRMPPSMWHDSTTQLVRAMQYHGMTNRQLRATKVRMFAKLEDGMAHARVTGLIDDTQSVSIPEFDAIILTADRCTQEQRALLDAHSKDAA